ncbi:MAG: hypothetical protein R2822_23535 [Spirosomataceae bacterium]
MDQLGEALESALRVCTAGSAPAAMKDKIMAQLEFNDELTESEVVPEKTFGNDRDR